MVFVFTKFDKMGMLCILGCLVLIMSFTCHAYPPHYQDYWHQEPSAYPSQTSPWNRAGVPNGGGGGDYQQASRRSDSNTNYHNHHYHHHHRDHDGENQEDEDQHFNQHQNPSYPNVGLYGAVPTRNPSPDYVSGGTLPGGQGQRGYEGQFGGDEAVRRSSRPAVNGRRGRRNETSGVLDRDISNGAPQVERRADGTLVLVYPNRKATVTRDAGMQSDGESVSDFIFPHPHDDEEHGDSQSKTVPSRNPTIVVAPRRKAPSCARGSTFCEEAHDYPKEYLRSLLQKDAYDYKDLFGEDELESRVNVTNRIDAIEDISLCKSSENVIFPQQAQNKDFQWFFIVNQEGYKQGVRVETCEDPDGKCYEDGFIVKPNFEVGCKQKYIVRKLVAFNGEKIAPDEFRFPSCCSCFIRPSANTRMANPFMAQRQSPAESSKSSNYH